LDQFRIGMTLLRSILVLPPISRIFPLELLEAGEKSCLFLVGRISLLDQLCLFIERQVEPTDRRFSPDLFRCSHNLLRIPGVIRFGVKSMTGNGGESKFVTSIRIGFTGTFLTIGSAAAVGEQVRRAAPAPVDSAADDVGLQDSIQYCNRLS
jgi:hypothetical protein